MKFKVEEESPWRNKGEFGGHHHARSKPPSKTYAQGTMAGGEETCSLNRKVS
jgi:hypothetical protein